ncbi:MAG TPA: hypothetical protein VKM55_27420 [Candidatus Lokiarchaeia archaeon]|nr:hypothetical protein [Candidatus Lokiarchaeia archaeon]
MIFAESYNFSVASLDISFARYRTRTRGIINHLPWLSFFSTEGWAPTIYKDRITSDCIYKGSIHSRNEGLGFVEYHENKREWTSNKVRLNEKEDGDDNLEE